MSIESEIDRIEDNIANAYDVMENAGAEMPTTRDSNNLASTVATIQGGGASYSAGTGIDITDHVISNTGLINTATGTNALLILGRDTYSDKSKSTAIGVNSGAAENSLAIGQNSTATGMNTTAIGDETQSTAMGSVSIGRGAHSTGKGAIALGNSARNTEANTLKVSLNGDASLASPAVDEASGLYTLLKSDGKIPFARVTDIDQLHDQFAFKRNSMTVYSQAYTTDGETWIEDTKNLNSLFICKDIGTDVTILKANEIGYTFTLTSTQFKYSEIECFELATAWVNPASTFSLKIEKSVNGETWDTIVNKTELKEQKMYYMPTSSKVSGETIYIKFTFTKTSNLDTGTVKVLTIRALTNRIGGQGMAREYSYPFNWDVNNTLLPLSNGSLGTSSNKWKNLYVQNLYPDVFSPNSITINNRSTTGLYYYKAQVGNANNYPYHRIGHVRVDAANNWKDMGAIIEIICNYTSGYYGKIKIAARAQGKTNTPFGSATIRWLERYGFTEDALQAGFYTVTDGDNSLTYVDFFLKTSSTYNCFQIKVIKGNRTSLQDDRNSTEYAAIVFNDSEETDNDASIIECYNAIQGTEAGNAEHELHNDVPYTSILIAEDTTVVKEAKQIYTKDLNNINADLNELFSKTVGNTVRYYTTSSPWSINILHKPYDSDMFTMEAETLRYLDNVRVILQTYHSGFNKKRFYRWGTGDSSNAPDGITWSDWKEEIVNSATKSSALTISGTATSGDQATNVGVSSSTSSYGVAFGYGAGASGAAGVAIGGIAKASGTAGVAIGRNAQAKASHAIALGANAVNNEDQTFKVALNNGNDSQPATDEASGLYTLLQSNGKIPAGRYIAFTGTDGTNDGIAGTVPQPVVGDETKFLCGDGTWKTVSVQAIQKVTTNNPLLTSSDNKCEWTVTHNLGTKDVNVNVYNISTDNEPICDINHTSTNTVTVTFNSTTDITADTYRAVIIG